VSLKLTLVKNIPNTRINRGVAMLEVSDIHVYYGLFEAVKGISLNIREKELVAIMGPNGHGKSTLIRAISGLVKIKGGKIEYNGKKIDKLKPPDIVKMGIIQVPEGGHLFPEMTVEENLLLGAYVPGAWRKRKENIQIVLDLFPILKDKMDQICLTLSGGERRAVAVGRGLMSSAKLLMLDEPSLGLSPLLAKELIKGIKKIKDTGIAIILVEENVRYIRELADRIYLVEQGKVTLKGKKDQVLENKHVKKAYLGII